MSGKDVEVEADGVDGIDAERVSEGVVRGVDAQDLVEVAFAAYGVSSEHNDLIVRLEGTFVGLVVTMSESQSRSEIRKRTMVMILAMALSEAL